MPVAPNMRPYWQFPENRPSIILFYALAFLGFILVFIGVRMQMQTVTLLFVVLGILSCIIAFIVFVRMAQQSRSKMRR